MELQYTKYFLEQVLEKRPYLKNEWLILALQNPIKSEIQEDEERIRHWIYIKEQKKYLRVVTLIDGITVHNAFFDRNFKED